MTWLEVLDEIRGFVNTTHMLIKGLAPQDSTYVGYEGSQIVPYIYVNGNRVFTNTNNLYNSVELKEYEGMRNNVTFKTLVNSGNVPYYRRAVLSPFLTVYDMGGYVDYGEGMDGDPIEIDNRNYMYYLEGERYIRAMMGLLNGRIYNISDRLEDFL